MLWGYQSVSLVAPVKFKTGSLNIIKTKKLKLLVKRNFSGDSCELPLVHMTFFNKDSISWQLQQKRMILELRSARAVPLTPTQLSATKKKPLSHRSHEMWDSNTLPPVLEVWPCSFCVTRKSNSLRADGEKHLQRMSLQRRDGIVSQWALSFLQSF